MLWRETSVWVWPCTNVPIGSCWIYIARFPFSLLLPVLWGDHCSLYSFDIFPYSLYFLFFHNLFKLLHLFIFFHLACPQTIFYGFRHFFLSTTGGWFLQKLSSTKLHGQRFGTAFTTQFWDFCGLNPQQVFLVNWRRLSGQCLLWDKFVLFWPYLFILSCH